MEPASRQLGMPFLGASAPRAALAPPERLSLLDRLRGDAARVAQRFALPRYTLDADEDDAVDRFGICYEDGQILVRLVHARTGRPLRYSALIDTVVHELAHLRHLDHGPGWEALYERMLAWCRHEGIYAPAARPRASQLGLFGGDLSSS
jgi:hypothetical protein